MPFRQFRASLDKLFDLGRFRQRRPGQLRFETLEDRTAPAGLPAVALGAGTGAEPRVTVFDADGEVVRSFLAFDPAFTGGVRVAVADLTGDGVAEVIAAAGPGGGPHVRVFDGASGEERNSFFAFESSFTGGVHVAASPELGIVTGPGIGGGPRVQVFDLDGNVRSNFFAYEPQFVGGVHVAADGNARTLDGVRFRAGLYWWRACFSIRLEW
jgi:hypothetical protein